MSETGIIIVEIPDPPTGNAVGDDAESQASATTDDSAGSGETSAAQEAQSDEETAS